jgi:hypothetical protein
MRSHIGIRYWELQEINYNIPYPEVVCHKNCGITDTEAAGMWYTHECTTYSLRVTLTGSPAGRGVICNNHYVTSRSRMYRR